MEFRTRAIEWCPIQKYSQILLKRCITCSTLLPKIRKIRTYLTQSIEKWENLDSGQTDVAGFKNHNSFPWKLELKKLLSSLEALNIGVAFHLILHLVVTMSPKSVRFSKYRSCDIVNSLSWLIRGRWLQKSGFRSNRSSRRGTSWGKYVEKVAFEGFKAVLEAWR